MNQHIDLPGFPTSDDDESDLPENVSELLDGIDPDVEVEKPTLDNYHTYKDRMSIETIRAHLALRPKTNQNPSDAALAALETLEADHEKNVALVAWAAGISEKSAKKRA